MDFQVLKKIKLNKGGQATVEYLLLIVVIVSAVMGLLSFSDTIEGKFKDLKIKARDQLAGQNYALTRKDFFTGKINTQGTGGGGTGAGKKDGAGGDDGGAGGKGKKKAEQAKAGQGMGEGGAGKGKAETQTQEPNTGARNKLSRSDYESESINQSNTAASNYNPEPEVSEELPKDKEKRDIMERQLALASAEEKARLLRKARGEGGLDDSSKPLAERDWGIGKFIIIIMLLLFFFVIILKAKQSRD